LSNLNEENITSKNNFKGSSLKSFFDGFVSRIKRIKHLDILLVIFFVVVILLIYFSTLTKKNEVKNTEDNTSQIQDQGNNYTYSSKTTSLESYKDTIEKKLSNTLSHIKNAGEVTVVVNFNTGIEDVIAYTTTSYIDENGKKVETKTPVLITVDGQTCPLILEQIMPEPSNIVVIASGAKDTSVKLEIQKAVQVLFNLQTSKIEIFAGN